MLTRIKHCRSSSAKQPLLHLKNKLDPVLEFPASCLQDVHRISYSYNIICCVTERSASEICWSNTQSTRNSSDTLFEAATPQTPKNIFWQWPHYALSVKGSEGWIWNLSAALDAKGLISEISIAVSRLGPSAYSWGKYDEMNFSQAWATLFGRRSVIFSIATCTTTFAGSSAMEITQFDRGEVDTWGV